MFTRLLTLLIALTLLTKPAIGDDDVYDWPDWVKAEINDVEHRCVDLGGYKALTHIWIEYRRLGESNRLLQVQLDHHQAIQESLSDQIVTSEQYIEALELNVESLKLSAHKRDTMAVVREISLWAAVILEGTTLIITAVQ